ncbi:enoyl-CoA hydratase/isomerase family protein [Pukyongiella litopenaei]|uniref:Enoyl-CoA hydratase/isomerase family protein n=1 Tax=Pukyongiella litopenaei TaxID=2605946 RepID=A0A2S0MVR9_9RHOB|nr:enoyl-CoA hydratase/isomerase family protein [Pukyongiella litopenaei]AVO39897.1 enoyl-CoA hydratase/isomerase family protein [Pukyongiella litopenaei]
MLSDNWILRSDHGGGVIELSLNRAPVNALSADFLMCFGEMLDDLATEQAVRAVVLTSPFAVFSAGLDLKEAPDFDLAGQHAIVEGLNVGFLHLFSFPKPVVTAIDGAAIAGGLFFVLAADYRVAGPRARFGLAEVRVGAEFPVGPLEIARATLGPNDLRRLMLTGRPVDAGTAAQSGIIDELVAQDAVVARAIDVARDLADNPKATYAAIKRQIRGAVIERIELAMADGANAPDGGWFNDETRDAMKHMIGAGRHGDQRAEMGRKDDSE